MSTHVPEFEVALAAGDFNAIETIWLNLLEDRPEDLEVFLALANKMARRKEQRRAAGLLIECAGPLKEAGKWADALTALKTSAGWNPREKKLWDELMEVVPKALAEFPDIDRIIEDGRDQHDGQVGPFLDYLDTWTRFAPGDFVEHSSGWGVGTVVGIETDEGKLVVDFATEKGQNKFALEAAGRMLNRLDGGHILVWKTYRPDELTAKVKDDPLEVVKMALRYERNRSLTQREIKTRLVPDVMDQKTWSRFLTNIKKKAQKDEYIKVSAGQNPTFELLAEAVTFDDAALERFGKPGTWEEKLDRARAYLSQINEHNYDPARLVPPMVEWARGVIDEDANGSKPSGLAALLFLEEVRGSFPDLMKDEVAVPALAYYFDASHPQFFVELLTQVPAPKYQREALATTVSENPDARDELLTGALYSDSQPLWEEAARQADATDSKVFEQFGEDVTRDPSEHPDNFLWYTRQFFVKHKTEEDAESIEERYRLFEKLLVLATQLNHQHARGSKNAKASLQRLKTLLSEDRNFMLSTIVKHLSLGQAQHLYHHLDAISALGNTLPPKLRRLLRKHHSDVEQAVIEETTGYVIDRTVTLTTRRGLTLRQRRHEKLQDDLRENAKAIGAALEMGDISENAELDAAREKEARLKQMLADITAELKSVKLLESDAVDTSMVTPGCTVEFSDEETGEAEKKTILGPWDSDHEAGIISYLAPMAEALLGSRKGDVVDMALQGHRRVRIEKITNALKSGEYESAPEEEVEDDEADEPVSARKNSN